MNIPCRLLCAQYAWKYLELCAQVCRRSRLYVCIILAHRLKKRKEFEDNLRRNRQVATIWIGYARFEESLNEFARYLMCLLSLHPCFHSHS